MEQKYLLMFIILLLTVTQTYAQNDKDETHKDSVEYILQQVDIIAPKTQMERRILPSSISVIDEYEIQEQDIRSLNEISAIAPNFFMPDYGTKLTSPVYIRGIGSRIKSPSVGLNVDHVPFFEKAAFDFDFFDIKQIEVLRGPQGTLYGRNTMGGIINIYTRSPLEFQGTKAEMNIGSYGLLNAMANHYDKLSDNFGYSVNLNYIQKDGFFKNEYSGNKVDEMYSTGSRFRLAWKLSDNSTVENITFFETSEQGGYPYAIYKTETQSAGPVNYNEESGYKRDLLSSALVYKYTKKRFDIQVTGSFQYMDDKNSIDQDFTEKSQFYVVQEQFHNIFSQEIIAKGKGNPRYDWLTGIYGFYQDLNNTVDVDYHSSNTNIFRNLGHNIYGFAAFHQSTFKNLIFNGLTFTGGLRADFEVDELDYLYNRNNVTQADTIYPQMESFELLPRFALSYDIDNKSNLYTVISRGYKTGGFNNTVERNEDLTYEPESSWNYEIGYKASLNNGKLYTEIAVFYIDWVNQQIYQPVPSGRGSMLKNAGHSISKGVELTLKASPFKQFDTYLSFGYTDAQFESHIVDESTDHSGNYLPYIPELTGSLHLSKSFIFNSEWFIKGLELNLTSKFIGKLFWNEENTNYQKLYNLTDANIVLLSETFEMNFWIKNIFDTEYSAFYFESLGNSFVQLGSPIRLGVRLGIKLY
ncbi:MAG: TonB-dependent receptor [Bacteroidota bacterium]